MTLMKVRLGEKKGKDSLRPLTEKEIQKKLYGGYLDTPQVEEEAEPEWVAPPKSKKGKETRTVALPKEPKKKITVSIPWGKIAASLSVAFKTLVGMVRILLSRVATGWSLGIVAIVVLFLAVHSLNSYRTAAMKATKPKRPQTIEMARRRRRPNPPNKTVQLSLEKKPLRQEMMPPLMPVSPVLSVVKEITPPPASGTQKPYVIQVCTYASEADANKLVDQMKQLHLSAFAQSLARSSGKTFYLVFLGRFETFQEAQLKLKEFRSQPIAKDFQDSFVREL